MNTTNNNTTEFIINELLEHLDDLFEQSDDMPLEYRSQGFTDALRNAEDLLLKHGIREKN